MARNPDRTSSATAAEGEMPEGRIKQIRYAYRVTRRAQPTLPLVLLGTFAAVFAVVFALGAGVLGGGFGLAPSIVYGVLGVILGSLVSMIVLSRRVQKTAYSQMEGQPGAAAGVLQQMKRWEVTPAVRGNRNQDMVHRAIGRPGIVLIGEGNASRLRGLLNEERRHLTRVLGPDVPIDEVIAGGGEGEVPISKLTARFTRMKPKLRPSEVTQIAARLRAVGERTMPIPKGPLPKGARIPRMPKG